MKTLLLGLLSLCCASVIEKHECDHTELERLMKKISKEQATKVAFSTALHDTRWGPAGPYPNDRTLVYEKVFINTGNGYNSNTGIFTAPVNGAYSFSYFIYGYSNTPMGVSLFKNEVRIGTAYDHPSIDSTDTAGNGAILQLEVGDRISVRLWANHQVYESSNRHNTFSGFLVFPL